MAVIGAALVAVIALIAGAAFVFGSDDDDDASIEPASTAVVAGTDPTDDPTPDDDTGDGDTDDNDDEASTVTVAPTDPVTTTTVEDEDDGGATAFAGQVNLESFNSAGDDVFTKPVAAAASAELVAYAGAGGASAGELPGEPGTDVPTDDIVLADANRSGALAGLYTGRPGEVVCEVDELLTELLENPEIAEIWAEVAEIDVEEIPEYLASLTAVVVATDLRVTNHGLVDGRAVARQAVLQVGTAILIDEFGVPRVRCQSGSPLTAPMPIDGPVLYAGAKWDSFLPERSIAVAAAPEPVEEFELVDYETGQTFSRPVGSTGAAPIEVAPDEVLAEGRFLVLDEFGFVDDHVEIVFPPAGGEAQATWRYTVTFEGVSVSADAAGPGVYDPVTRTMTGTGTATVSGGGFSSTEDFTWQAVVDPVAGIITGTIVGAEGEGAFELTFEPYETE